MSTKPSEEVDTTSKIETRRPSLSVKEHKQKQARKSLMYGATHADSASNLNDKVSPADFQGDNRPNNFKTGGYHALIMVIVIASVLLAVVSWTLTMLNLIHPWYPRALIPTELTCVMMQFGVSTEEGPFVSQLFFYHFAFVFFFNGVMGLIWYATLPVATVVASAYAGVNATAEVLATAEQLSTQGQAGVGWAIFFGIFVAFGLLIGATARVNLHHAFLVRFLTITVYGDRIGEFAIDCVNEGVGSILFQLLTLAQQILACSMVSTGNAVGKNAMTLQGNMCSAGGHAAFGSAFFVWWIYFLNVFVLPMGITLRHILSGNAHPVIANLALGTLGASPFAAVLIVSGFSQGIPAAAIEFSFIAMLLGTMLPFVYMIIFSFILAALYGAGMHRGMKEGHSDQAERDFIAQFLGVYEELSTNFWSKEPPVEAWWPSSWNDDIRWGSWGAVCLERPIGEAAKTTKKIDRVACGMIEISEEPCMEADVEEGKWVHDMEGCSKDVLKWPYHAIDYLNKREMAGDPWPYDEAYCFNSPDNLTVRLFKIRNRNDGLGVSAEKQVRKLQAELTDVKARLKKAEMKVGLGKED